MPFKKGPVLGLVFPLSIVKHEHNLFTVTIQKMPHLVYVGMFFYNVEFNKFAVSPKGNLKRMFKIIDISIVNCGLFFSQLSEKRKLSLGWVPHPKAAKTRFNNEILPTFYEASYPVDDRRFKKDFIAERNHGFDSREKIDKYDSKLLFIRGDNPAAATF